MEFADNRLPDGADNSYLTQSETWEVGVLCFPEILSQPISRSSS